MKIKRNIWKKDKKRDIRDAICRITRFQEITNESYSNTYFWRNYNFNNNRLISKSESKPDLNKRFTEYLGSLDDVKDRWRNKYF